MLRYSHLTLAALGSALLALASAQAARGAAVGSCALDYERADNMWATRPDGDLGVESITLQWGQMKVFSTDWRYEKLRNDGTNYYGSHLRRATNRGTTLVRVRTVAPFSGGYDNIPPGVTHAYQADLAEVSCPTPKT